MPKHTDALTALSIGDVKQVMFTRRYTEDHPDFVSWEQWVNEYWERESDRSGLTFDQEPLIEHSHTVVTKAKVSGKRED